MINQEYQLSILIFLNVGRKCCGELVSCFLFEVNDLLNDILRVIDIFMQFLKLGGGVFFNLFKFCVKGEVIKDVENVIKGVVGVMKFFDNVFCYVD